MKKAIKSAALIAGLITALLYTYIRGYNTGFQDAVQIEKHRVVKPETKAKI